MNKAKKQILNSLNCQILKLPKELYPNKEEQRKIKRMRERRKIYFIQCETGEIKIGSANNVKERLKILQIGCPFKLKLLKTISIKETEYTEKVLYKKFKKYRKLGEWFYPDEKIMKFIENCIT